MTMYGVRRESIGFPLNVANNSSFDGLCMRSKHVLDWRTMVHKRDVMGGKIIEDSNDRSGR
jgi:hypothetical protein